MRKPIITISIVAIAALGIGIIFGSLTRSPDQNINDLLSVSTVLEGAARPLSEFTLKTHTEAPFNSNSLLNQWSFIFFGYTSCPDICPITLMAMNEMINALDADIDQSKIKVYFVSVDPHRDTSERLSQYVPFFNENFVGITGKETQLRKLVQSLNSLYKVHKTNEASVDYLVDHSTSILLINPEGKFHAVFSAPHQPKKIATDFAHIYQHASG